MLGSLCFFCFLYLFQLSNTLRLSKLGLEQNIFSLFP